MSTDHYDHLDALTWSCLPNKGDLIIDYRGVVLLVVSDPEYDYGTYGEDNDDSSWSFSCLENDSIYILRIFERHAGWYILQRAA